jgi:hypothetical protein
MVSVAGGAVEQHEAERVEQQCRGREWVERSSARAIGALVAAHAARAHVQPTRAECNAP